MVPIGKGYFYHDGKVYKEIKPQGSKTQRWKLITKTGQRKWITKEQLDSLVKHKHI